MVSILITTERRVCKYPGTGLIEPTVTLLANLSF